MKSKSWPQLLKLNQRLFDQLNIALNDDEKLIVFDSLLVKQRRKKNIKLKKSISIHLFQFNEWFFFWNFFFFFVSFFYRDFFLKEEIPLRQLEFYVSFLDYINRLLIHFFRFILLIVSVLFPYIMLCVPSSNYVNQWIGKVI